MTRFDPAGPLRGELHPPPDKSISHRAALIAAMSRGQTRIEGYLDAADTRVTLAAIRGLGASVEELADGAATPGSVDLAVTGIDLRGPGERAAEAELAIEVGNAGTLLRLLPGWLAGQERGRWVLAGDESIARRPVDRVVEPLALMGGRLEAREGRLPPLVVEGAPLRGIEYRLPVASAQVKSCVLLAGLLAAGETSVVEPAPTRNHTELMLRAAGAPLRSEPARTPLALRGAVPGQRVTVTAADALEPGKLSVPGDFSSAAFMLVAALLVPGSEVRLAGVGLNATRVGLLGILSRMGAAVEVEEGIPAAGEPRGRLLARHSTLAGTRVASGEVAVAIDELPLVALLGCFAEGETVVRGAEELRAKESDRIATVVDGLAALGAEIEALDDGFAVRGSGGLRGGTLDAHGDHRLAMLGAVAGLASREGVEVRGVEAAEVSYPGFERDLQAVAGRLG